MRCPGRDIQRRVLQCPVRRCRGRRCRPAYRGQFGVPREEETPRSRLKAAAWCLPLKRQGSSVSLLTRSESRVYPRTGDDPLPSVADQWWVRITFSFENSLDVGPRDARLKAAARHVPLKRQGSSVSLLTRAESRVYPRTGDDPLPAVADQWWVRITFSFENSLDVGPRDARLKPRLGMYR